MATTSRTVCKVEGCPKESRGRVGYCDAHYRKKLKYGDPTVVVNDTGKPPIHFKHGRSTTPGEKKDRTYSSWTSMHWRTTSNSSSVYSLYKGKGITVCERWSDFSSFLEDMGERPAGTSLDRIDGTKGYSPENCRWADARTQARNTTWRKLDLISATSIAVLFIEGMKVADIARFLGHPYARINAICRRGKWPDAMKIALTMKENGETF